MVIPKIKQCLPLVDGIWKHIDYNFPEEFSLTPSQLDTIFLSNWSQRLAAPILSVVHNDNTTTMLTQTELETLAGLINGMFKHRWDKLIEVALAEYDPIHNYYDELTEHTEYGEDVTHAKTAGGTSSNTRTDNLTDTKTDGRTITETRNLQNSGTDSSNNGIYGFNSSSAVGDTNSSGSNSGSETGTVGTVHSGNITETNTGTQSNSGTTSSSESGSDGTTGEKDRTYTKTGNIGNISTQKLLNEELELWQYNFVYEMMRDVINFVSLPTYETEVF